MVRRILRSVVAAAVSVALSSCGGGGGASTPSPPQSVVSPGPTLPPGATPTPASKGTPTATPGPGVTPSPAPKVTPTPTPPPSGSFYDVTTYGYDDARSGFDPSETTLSAANVGNLHVAWTFPGRERVTQAIVAANLTVNGSLHNVVFTGDASGNVDALDLRTGNVLWQRTFTPGSFPRGCGSNLSGVPIGVQGTFVYDRSRGYLYVPDGQASVHALNATTGATLWSADVAPDSIADGGGGQADMIHGALTLANGKLYAIVGGNCDAGSWHGRIVAIDPGSGAQAAPTLFTGSYNVSTQVNGAGVWGWGGVSADSSGNLYSGAGNGVPSNLETAALGDHVFQLSPSLAVEQQNYPNYTIVPAPGENGYDLDMSGTPVVFQPPGCPTMIASQGKGGYVVIYDTTSISRGPIATIEIYPSDNNADSIGNPAYSPQTGYLYVSTLTSNRAYSQYPQGLAAFRFVPGACTVSASPAFTAQFGPDDQFGSNGSGPRSPPAIANGIVFAGAQDGVLYARDAFSGAPLWDSTRIAGWPVNSEILRTPATIDNGWVFVSGYNSGTLYALTTDSSVPASPAAIANARRWALGAPRRPRFAK